MAKKSARWVTLGAVVMLPVSATASTKYLKCTQTTDSGVAQILNATLDDDSNMAEVELFALSAECAQDRSCGTKIYTKDVLPSVIRLTNVLQIGNTVSYVTTIDIDRKTLAVVTRTKLTTPDKEKDSIAHGKCSVSTDNSRKLL